MRGWIAAQSNALHGHLRLIPVGKLWTGLLNIREVTSAKESLGVVHRQLQGTGKPRVALVGLNPPSARVQRLEIRIPSPRSASRCVADQRVKLRSIRWEEDPRNPGELRLRVSDRDINEAVPIQRRPRHGQSRQLWQGSWAQVHWQDGRRGSEHAVPHGKWRHGTFQREVASGGLSDQIGVGMAGDNGEFAWLIQVNF